MPVPFVDLAAMNEEIREELDDLWAEATRSGAFIGGRRVEEFETEWARYCGRDYAVGVGNGTDAIEIALRAAGIGVGDEVVIPTNTFIATVEAVVAVGATPVLVDVDEDTLLLRAEHVGDALSPRTAAVIVVHLFGQVAAMDGIIELCEARGLLLVEDAAQAHGATLEGRTAGSFGQVATFSFYPSKNLGAFGDGGAIVTDNVALARSAREIANHGAALDDRYRHRVVGRNSRLDALQAAILSAKLRRLPEWNEKRRSAAYRYGEYLANVADLRPLTIAPGTSSAHHLYVVRTGRRDELLSHLEMRRIGVGIHYPVPCHLQEPYRRYASSPLPVAEAAAREILSLPMFPHIEEMHIREVVQEASAVLGLREAEEVSSR